jgi:hypothetical protein
MPLSYSKVQKDEAKVTVSAYGETLTLVYYPSRMTDEIFIKFASIGGIQNIEEATEGLTNINGILSNVVKSWDFFEDDEQKVMWPLTPERLAQLEMSFKMKCLVAVMSDVRPNSDPSQTLT